MNLCRSLRARLALVPGLLDLLEQVAVGAPVNSPSGEILMMFFRHDRPRYDRLIGGMITRWLGHSSGVSSILSLAGAADTLDDALAAALVRVAREAIYIGTAEARPSSCCTRTLLDRVYEEGPMLLAVDPSFILAPSLLWLAHPRRQDLLDPVPARRHGAGPLRHGQDRLGAAADRGLRALVARAACALRAGPWRTSCADRERDTPTIGRADLPARKTWSSPAATS